MAICNVGDLMSAANCFACLTQEQLALIRTSLLCEILRNSNPMATCDVQELMNSASCFACVPPGQLSLIQTQLLCEILNAGGASGAGCLLCAQAADPVNAPDCDCALYYRRDNGSMWYWDSALVQWVLLIGG